MSAKKFERGVFKAAAVIDCIEIFIELIAVIMVIYRLLKRARMSLLSFYVKLIMGAYLIMLLTLNAIVIAFFAVEDSMYKISEKHLGIWYSFFSVGFCMWNAIHWTFTFHFLSVACLFKMTF